MEYADISGSYFSLKLKGNKLSIILGDSGTMLSEEKTKELYEGLHEHFGNPLREWTDKDGIVSFGSSHFPLDEWQYKFDTKTQKMLCVKNITTPKPLLEYEWFEGWDNEQVLEKINSGVWIPITITTNNN